MSSRSSSYNYNEDILLCRIYMDISQDPCVGVYQTSDRFWKRVETSYNNDKNEQWENRSQRSIQARIQAIEKATKKLHACIRATENRHQSGASNEDIMQQAKILLMEYPKYKSGWKFDHVWGIIKDFEKFKDCGNSSKRQLFGHLSSESDYPNFEGQASPGISCSLINLNDDFNASGGSPSERPISVKKAKLKKRDDPTLAIANMVQEGNKHLLEEMQKSSAELKEHLAETRAIRQARREDKILFQDLSSITDPHVLAYIEAERAHILQKRAQERDQSVPFATGTFGGYFNNLEGSGSGLSDY